MNFDDDIQRMLDDLEERRKALLLVQEMRSWGANKQAPPTAERQRPVPAKRNGSPRTLNEMSREIVGRIGTEEFTSTQFRLMIEEAFGVTVNKNSFSAVFDRLKKNNEIVLVEEGSGRMPGRYRKAK